MKRILFFDIDGTLSYHGQICPSTLQALEKLKENGDLVFICTGRPPFYAKNLFKDLVSGYITCNGRCILYQDSILLKKELTTEQMDHYSDLLLREKAGHFFNSEEGIYIKTLDEKSKNFLEREYGLEKVWMEQGDHSYYNFDITYSSLEHRDILIEKLKDSIVVNDHGGMGSADCSLKDFDKGCAIAYLLEHFEISKENAYAFGDGMNDQAMFREVKNKIAMENAVPELKEKASYITTSVLEDGIWNALEHFQLI